MRVGAERSDAQHHPDRTRWASAFGLGANLQKRLTPTRDRSARADRSV